MEGGLFIGIFGTSCLVLIKIKVLDCLLSLIVFAAGDKLTNQTGKTMHVESFPLYCWFHALCQRLIINYNQRTGLAGRVVPINVAPLR